MVQGLHSEDFHGIFVFLVFNQFLLALITFQETLTTPTVHCLPLNVSTVKPA